MTRRPELVAGPRVVAQASAQLEPEAVCVDILRSLCRNPLRLPEVHEQKQLVGRHGTEKALLWRAIWNRTDLATFLEIQFPQISRKAITSTKVPRVPRAGRSTRKARDRVVLRSLAPPIPPDRESLEPTPLPAVSHPQCLPAVKRTRSAVTRWGPHSIFQTATRSHTRPDCISPRHPVSQSGFPSWAGLERPQHPDEEDGS
jgi:hypothetical protein